MHVGKAENPITNPSKSDLVGGFDLIKSGHLIFTQHSIAMTELMFKVYQEGFFPLYSFQLQVTVCGM